MILNTHSSQELKALSNKVKDHRMRLRLLAVSHFKSGKNRAEIARMLNMSRRIVKLMGSKLMGSEINGVRVNLNEL